MAGRCSCAGGSCSCQIIQGNGVSVAGTGNASAPYVISAAPVQDARVISVNGDLDLSALAGYAAVLVTLNANVTSITLPLATTGSRIDLIIQQGVAGAKTVAWPAAIKFPGGVDPVITVAANAVDWVTLVQAQGVWVGVKTGAALA